MRHSRPTLFSAFATGFFWAGAGTLTAVGLYYYLAPPADAQSSLDNIKISIAELVPGLARWTHQAHAVQPANDAPANTIKVSEFAAEQQTVLFNDGVALKEAQVRVAQQQADVQAQRVLVRSIQQELQRVGCYGGSVDGNWSDGTRSAMGAFNDSVQVKLPLKSPDYILLTMLQGHARQACGSTTADKSQVAATRVAPRVRREIAAAPAAAVNPAPNQAASVAKNGWSTTVTSQTPPAASSTVAAMPPAHVPTATNTDVPLMALAPTLPGRMAIGAPAIRPDAPSQFAPQYAAVPQVARPATPPLEPRPAARASEPVRVAAPPPPRKTSSNNSGSGGNSSGSSASRGASVFNSLSRSAP